MVDSLDAYYEAVPTRHRGTVDAVRRVVSEVHPDAEETLKWNQPTFVLDGENRFYIAWYEDHVNLGIFAGADVDDPDGLLDGTGKAMRHVAFHDAEAVGDPAVRALVERAG